MGRDGGSPTLLARLGRGLAGMLRSEKRSMAAGMGAFLPPPVMSGISVTPESALTFSAYFAGVNRLATDLASMPLEVKRYTANGSRIRVPRDPRQRLVFTSPNNETTPIRWRTAQMAHVISWGNSYAEIERYGDGTPAALHLLNPRPQDTRPERTRSGKLFYLHDGGRGRPIPAENVLHVAGLGWDGLVGYSVVAFGRQAIGLGIAAEQFGASFFGNGSTPKGALRKPTKLSKDAQDRLRDQWERIHQGVVNSNRVAILEEGLEWQSIGIPPEDAQFLATRQFQVLEICRLLGGMPPHKLGDFSQSHQTNIEESNREYVDSILRPWAIHIEQEGDLKLFTDRERAHGLHLFHNMSALLRGNTTARTARNTAMRNGGALSANEWRIDEGLNPRDDAAADKLVMQGQYQPLERLGKDPMGPLTRPAPAAETDPEDDDV